MSLASPMGNPGCLYEKTVLFFGLRRLGSAANTSSGKFGDDSGVEMVNVERDGLRGFTSCSAC